jgi:hypothetical protein
MKGICFKEPLFHATIEGRKTQTRRIMTPQPQGCFVPTEKGYQDGHYINFNPRYNVGDVVYLKEPYALIPKAPDSAFISTAQMVGSTCVFHKWNPDDLFSLKWDAWDIDEKGFWRNKLFMPAEAARYFIHITAVRAERLQEISDEDCMKEGIEYIPVIVSDCGEYPSYGIKSIGIQYETPREAYAALIDKINGRGTWRSNPRVWVYDYELCEKINRPRA